MSKDPSNATSGMGRLWLALTVRFLLLALAVYFVVRSQRGWSDAAYWSAGLTLAHAGDWAGIYDPAVNPYAMRGYSPVALYFVLYPLGYLSERGIRMVLATLTILMWVAAVIAMNRALAAVLPRWRGGADATWGMGICQRFLGSDLMANQINALSFAPACFGMCLMLGGSWPGALLGGSMIAIAAGMKLYPLALIALLFIKRAWFQAALATSLAAVALWFGPRWLLGATEFDRVRATQAATDGGKLWLHESSHELWGLPNVLYFHGFGAPASNVVQTLSPFAFQMLMLSMTLAIGFALLPTLTRQRWSEMTGESLWEDLAIVGVALCIVDPVGRTAHFVMTAPAHCLLVCRWLNDWDQNRSLPSKTRLFAYAIVLLTNNFLFISLPGLRHYWYAHYGLFALGMFTLLVLTVDDVRRRHRPTSRPIVARESIDRSRRAA